MTFILQTELTIHDGKTVKQNRYETVLHVEILEQDEGMIIYDKELDMHFIDNSRQNLIYEIELDKICLTLSEPLDKANDFTRRIMLRYDYIQPKVNAQGKVVSVENIKELQDSWQQLKESILEDYEGDAVTDYLQEVEEKMMMQNYILSPMSQYFFFGLLFPGIPASHHFNNWKNTRTIEISDYEEEKFQETVSFDRETDNLRLYRVSGNTLPGSTFVLEDFSGLIQVEKGEILPVQADITISYRIYNQLYQWEFRLEQY